MDWGQVVKAGMNNGDGNGKKRHKPAFGENTGWTGQLGRKSRAWESACTWGELAMTPAQQETCRGAACGGRCLGIFCHPSHLRVRDSGNAWGLTVLSPGKVLWAQGSAS